jgi:hypothetical protein
MVPAWMTDPAECARHTTGPALASIEALTSLARLLDAACGSDVAGSPLAEGRGEAIDEPVCQGASRAPGA